MSTEEAKVFSCDGDSLIGILHRPERPAKRAVVIVVGGGPQYRVGGHRQLVLWSRRLCDQGIAVLRFDYRGMGDSYGDFAGFENVDADIKAAIDYLFAEVAEVEEVVLWGECDASSAIIFYAWSDSRVKGAVLLNPWVHTPAGQAKAFIKHYYWHRLKDKAFWEKVISLQFDVFGSLKSFLANLKSSFANKTENVSAQVNSESTPIPRNLDIPSRMYIGFARFQAPIMLVMSGRDFVAREFDDLIASSQEWRDRMSHPEVVRYDIPDADHTFSTNEWRNAVVGWAETWLKSW
ncbi:MAG: hydrolase 1, exosortase A system-associated [Pseudomonadales bacterium]|nr:hydrolase 1, exosortase A system-associated [Pseudomonadales bacterium]